MNNRREQVGFIGFADVLHHNRQPFQAHSRINRRLGQWRERASLVAVVLHKHQVPDFHVLVAVVRVHARRNLVGGIVADVIMDFGRRPTRAGIARRPQIICRAKAQNPLGGQILLPQLHSFFISGNLVIAFKHRHPHAGWIKLDLLSQKFPGKANRVLFKVIAKRKVAQHLEKRVVTRRWADIFQVVLLARNSQTFLRRHRTGIWPRLATQKHIIKRHHPCHSKQQGWVVRWNQ